MSFSIFCLASGEMTGPLDEKSKSALAKGVDRTELYKTYRSISVSNPFPTLSARARSMSSGTQFLLSPTVTSTLKAIHLATGSTGGSACDIVRANETVAHLCPAAPNAAPEMAFKA